MTKVEWWSVEVEDPDKTLPHSAQVPSPGLYKRGPLLLNPIMGVFELHHTGTENIPFGGPYALIPKHRSNRDTPAVGSSFLKATGNTIHFLTKEEWYRIAPARLLNAIGGIRYNRAVQLAEDTRASHGVEGVVAKGGVLGIYPEGTRTRGSDLREKMHVGGLGMLAIEHGIPLVPVGVEGTEGHLSAKAVAYGQPINGERLQIDRREDRATFAKAAREVAEQIRPGLTAAIAQALEIL